MLSALKNNAYEGEIEVRLGQEDGELRGGYNRSLS